MNRTKEYTEKKSSADFIVGLIIFCAVYIAAAYMLIWVLPPLLEKSGLMKNAEQTSADGVSFPTVVIDAGHGGEDGGASVGDVLEKDLNLALSKDIKAYFDFLGVPSVMTRSEDKMLYDIYGGEDFNGRKKQLDLVNRVKFSKENGDIFLSIHMNKFPIEKYSGSQIYYSGANPQSKVIAERIQKGIKSLVQPWNEREIKKATTSIFVLNKQQMPSVLVECGFLSNTEERELLTTENYRKKLALVIALSTVEEAVGE